MKRAIRDPPRRLRRHRGADRRPPSRSPPTSSSTSRRSRSARATTPSTRRSPTAAAVTSGQGQAVTIAGVQVGQVGGVSLHDGQAVVHDEHLQAVRADLPQRDRAAAAAHAAEGHVPGAGSGHTPAPAGSQRRDALGRPTPQPDVDVSEILSSLDADTRNYLLLLLSGGAQAFHDPGDDRRSCRARARWPTCGARSSASSRWTATPRRFAAPAGHAPGATSARAIHNLNLVANALGGRRRPAGVADPRLGHQLRRDLRQRHPARGDAHRSSRATLRQTNATLGKVQGFATASTTTLQQLVPFAHNLGPALKASRPLFHDTTPVIANQLRPFSVAVQPLARTLAAGGAQARGDDPVADRIDLGAQHAVQRARPPAGRRPAGLPVLGLLAGAHRRQPRQLPGRQRRGRCRASSWAPARS